jgi:hypothetical protein
MNADRCDGSHVDIFTISRHESPASATPTVVDLCELPPPPAYCSLTYDLDPPPPYSEVDAKSIVTSLPPLSISNSSSSTHCSGVHDTPLQQLPASHVSSDLQTTHHESQQQRSNDDHTSDGPENRVRKCCSGLYLLFVCLSWFFLPVINIVFFVAFVALSSKFMDLTVCIFLFVYLRVT